MMKFKVVSLTYLQLTQSVPKITGKSISIVSMQVLKRMQLFSLQSSIQTKIYTQKELTRKMFRLQARLSTLCQSARVQLPDVARGHNHHGYKLPPGVACCSTQAKSQSKPEEKIKKLMVANRGIASLVLYLLIL